jgi:Domain of unknown function (DUF4388)
MQPNRFCVLTGHLNDYPLSDLVGILRHQQKTGRLLIEYEKGPAMFFFKNGELVDVQMDKLSGLQAICVAMGQSPASFNFNPLIQPTRRSIEPVLQGTVSELLGCWDENAIDLEPVEPEAAQLPDRDYEAPALLSSPAEEPILEATNQVTAAQLPRLLALPPAPVQSRYGLFAVIIAVGGLLLAALTTLIGTSGSTRALPNPSLEAATASLTSAQAPLVSSESTKVQRRSESKTKSSHAVATSHATANGNERATSSESAEPKTEKIDAKATTVPSEPREETKTEQASSGRAVKVVLHVTDGRVTTASISNHQPGMDAYEALALRIARQRRYPAKSTGQQVITIKVNQP